MDPTRWDPTVPVTNGRGPSCTRRSSFHIVLSSQPLFIQHSCLFHCEGVPVRQKFIIFCGILLPNLNRQDVHGIWGRPVPIITPQMLFET